MEQRVAPYVRQIMEALSPLFSGSHEAQNSAISCIGALAGAAREQFSEYIDMIVPSLMSLMRLRAVEDVDLLCQAIGKSDADQPVLNGEHRKPCLIAFTLHLRQTRWV